MGDDILRVYNVVASLPDELAPLQELAYNAWFSWHSECVSLFHRLDRKLWAESSHNPVLMLGKISQQRIEQVLDDEGFMSHMKRVHEQFKTYLASSDVYDYGLDKPLPCTVAYLSTEFGLADCIPIYSGGLGVLSGDHLKSASDLNLPLVGVGLFYQHGYFQQYLNADGWQQEHTPPNDFHNMPVHLIYGDDGRPLSIELELQGRRLVAHAWRIQVGRIPLYLLDTNVRSNPTEYREITAQLYGGDRETRLRQEYVLGVGGVRLLKALDLPIGVYHLNEGHSAFALFERMRRLRAEEGLSYEEARAYVTGTTVFTTHTPVPAGNESFDPRLVSEYFVEHARDLGISVDELLGQGRQAPSDDEEFFGMTVLALKNAGYANGVSKLHAEVARRMWTGVWHGLGSKDVPIRAVTNGIHIPSWVSSEMATLFDRYLGPRWVEDPDSERVWQRIEDIPDSELWRTHERRRERLIAFVRSSLAVQLNRRGASTKEVGGALDVLNPEALTIGFARRFATYKRGNLFLADPERFARLLSNSQRPVQIIVAGKAHPKDDLAKGLIRNIIQFVHAYDLRNHVVFLENYDINVARYMVQGCDIWLNCPRRPHEACGTSGMKAVANGCLHMSILDGWWAEAYTGDNGFSIGQGEEYQDLDHQDRVESDALYKLLEESVVPLFYETDKSHLPRNWIRRMKNSMRSLNLVFNSHRMVEQYATEAYAPAALKWEALSADQYGGARDLAAWQSRVQNAWDDVEVVAVRSHKKEDLPVGAPLKVECKVDLAGLDADDVAVDIYYGPMTSAGYLSDRRCARMTLKGKPEGTVHTFKGQVPCAATGRFGFKLRVLPAHPHLRSAHSLDRIVWG